MSDHWRKTFCSMVVEMDDAVGKLVGMLKAAGLWGTTLMALVADNGGMTKWDQEASST